MLAGLPGTAALLERSAQAEVGEVVDRVAVHDGLELVGGCLVAAGTEVRAAERLADRALLRLELARLLERDRRGGEITVLEKLAAALEQVVDLLAVFLRRHA